LDLILTTLAREKTVGNRCLVGKVDSKGCKRERQRLVIGLVCVIWEVFVIFFFLKREVSDKKKPTFLFISIKNKTFFFKKFFFFGLISCGFDFEGAFVA
jgi:hypothetical protein